MTSRLKNDPDMRYFTEHLQERPAGRHYLAAWCEMEHCLKQIRLAISVGAPTELRRWRRAYIKATMNCTHRLQVLESAHSWPTV